MFILRQLIDDGSGNTVSIEVTKVEFDQVIPPDVFVFRPPPGSREVQASQSSSSSFTGGQRTITVPAGFYAPAYLPDGYVTVSSGTSSSGGVTSGIERTLSPPGRAGRLVIEERFRAGGFAALGTPMGTPINVKDVQGYWRTEAGDIVLSWEMGDILLTLTGTGLGLDELLRVAESMELSAP
jgi:hypothetical protein